MQNPFRRVSVYANERARLLTEIAELDPRSEDYATVMARINDLDKILNRTSELVKTVVPAAGTGIGVLGIYALQQFGGVLVPRALEALASRSDKKSHKDD